MKRMKGEELAAEKMVVQAGQSSTKPRPLSFPKKGSLIIVIDDDGHESIAGTSNGIQQISEKTEVINIEDDAPEGKLKTRTTGGIQDKKLEKVASKKMTGSPACQKPGGASTKKLYLAPGMKLTRDQKIETGSRACQKPDKKQGGVSTKKLYLAPGIKLTRDQKNEIRRIWEEAREKSPIYVVTLKKTQLTSGLGFSKNFSVTLPTKQNDLMLMTDDCDSFVDAKLKKYSNGRAYVTSGWGKFAKSRKLKMKQLHAIQFSSCRSNPDQLCLTVFSLP
ncbi:hypothetical protein ACP70R_038444 [Stipagrostis hirtigluma subsp. patula]